MSAEPPRAATDPLPRIIRSPLPNLRIGSRLVARNGVIFTVCEALLLLAENGGKSLVVIVERAQKSRVDQLLLTVGVLANLARGATHKPGSGAIIDWAQVQRRRHSDYPRFGLHQPIVVRLRPLASQN